MSSQHQTCDVSDGETGSVILSYVIRMCGLAVYLDFDSLVWLAVNKQVSSFIHSVEAICRAHYVENVESEAPPPTKKSKV